MARQDASDVTDRMLNMAKYFFHIVNGEFLPDTLGTECDGADDVKSRAVVAAGEMLSEQGLQLWKTGRWYMFVADDQNKTLLKLSFEAEDLTGELGGEKR